MSVQSRQTNNIVANNTGCLGLIVLPIRVLVDIFNSLIKPETRRSMLILLASVMTSCVCCFGAAAAISAGPGDATLNTPAPTIDVNAIHTKAMLDAWSAFTQTAEALPTSTLTSTVTPLPTNTPAPTITPRPTNTNTPLPTATFIFVPPTQPEHPLGTSGRCVDGTYTSAQHKQGACSHHGGVAQWWGP